MVWTVWGVAWALLLAPGADESAEGVAEQAKPAHQCTVMMPQIVTEMRTVKVCEWRTEERQAIRTVCRHIPETRSVEYEYTVPTYETRAQEFVYSVYRPVYSTQHREYTVMVPYTEQRKGTRYECRMVPVTQTRTVCEDHGNWQESVQRTCGCCGAATRACKVWVPKLETREVEYTVMRSRTEEVPCEYTVTLFRPEKRSDTVQVCNYVRENVKRSVPFTVCVPKTRTGTRQVTTYRTVEEQKIYTYKVRVPQMVARQVPVQVCRMVAKQVPCPSQSGCCCGTHCW